MQNQHRDRIQMCAREKVDKFLHKQAGKSLDAKAVHDLRVLSKRLRAYLKLYPDTCAKSVDNTKEVLKSLADAYAQARDAEVQSDLIKSLMAADKSSCTLLQQKIVAKYDSPGSGAKDRPEYEAELKRVFQAWPKRKMATADIDSGLRHVFKKAKRTGSEAIAKPTGELCHSWRKQSKRWLYCSWDIASDPPSKSYHKRLKKLCSKLGEHHDLFVLEQSLLDERVFDRGDPSIREAVAKLNLRIEEEKTALEKKFPKYFDALYNQKVRKLKKKLAAA